jgi:histidine phosphotransferase ChpT
MRTDIAALIGSRICHDLISPIGAIGNGVELLTLTSQGTPATPALTLITESVDSANARIRFFRIAFGAASADQRIARKEVISVLAAMEKGGRLAYFWQICEAQRRDLVRIAFLLMQCVETALPLGGTIDIKSDGAMWEIIGTGKRVTFAPALWDSLTNTTVEIDHTAAQVQFALLPDALKAARRFLAVTHTKDSIVLRF